MSEEIPELPEEPPAHINPTLRWYVWLVRLMPQVIYGTLFAGVFWQYRSGLSLFSYFRHEHVFQALFLISAVLTLVLGHVHERLMDAVAGREQKSAWWLYTLGAIVFCIMQLISFPVASIIMIIPILLLF